MTLSTWQYRSWSCSSICCWHDKYSNSSAFACFFLPVPSTHTAHCNGVPTFLPTTQRDQSAISVCMSRDKKFAFHITEVRRWLTYQPCSTYIALFGQWLGNWTNHSRHFLTKVQLKVDEWCLPWLPRHYHGYVQWHLRCWCWLFWFGKPVQLPLLHWPLGRMTSRLNLSMKWPPTYIHMVRRYTGSTWPYFGQMQRSESQVGTGRRKQQQQPRLAQSTW